MGTPRDGRCQIRDHARIQEMGSWGQLWEQQGGREPEGRLARAGGGRDWTLLGCQGKEMSSAEGEPGEALSPDGGEAGTEPHPHLPWSISDIPQLPLGEKQEVPGPVRKADPCLSPDMSA